MATPPLYACISQAKVVAVKKDSDRNPIARCCFCLAAHCPCGSEDFSSGKTSFNPIAGGVIFPLPLPSV